MIIWTALLFIMLSVLFILLPCPVMFKHFGRIDKLKLVSTSIKKGNIDISKFSMIFVLNNK